MTDKNQVRVISVSGYSHDIGQHLIEVPQYWFDRWFYRTYGKNGLMYGSDVHKAFGKYLADMILKGCREDE